MYHEDVHACIEVNNP